MKISLLLVILIIFGRLFLPGVHVANDLHLIPQSEIKESLSLPYAWNISGSAGFGEYAIPFLWSWPLHLVSGLSAYLNFTFPIILNVTALLPILVIAIYGIKKLLEYSGVNSNGKFVGILLFLTNSYILLLIDGGQLTLALAYSILPLIFYFYRISMEGKGFKDLLNFSLSTIFLSFFDIRIIYLLLILIVFDFMFEILSSKRHFTTTLKSYLILGSLSSVFLLCFHAYWIVPAILSKAPTLPLTYGRSAQVDFLSFATLGHALYFLQPHWYKNVFGEITSIRWYFVFIPVLVFLAPALKKKNRWVGFYAIIAIISLFLVKGSSEPLPGIYNWLFIHIPGFSLFRDPTKFFFLTAISFSILFAMSFEEIVKRFKLDNRWLFLIVVGYLVWLDKPIISGQMTGMFNKPIYEQEYNNLENLIERDKDFARIFWIPVQPPLGFSNYFHLSLEASRLAQLRPFAIGTKGTYETFNFLREAPYMGEIFDVAGIGYIVDPFLDPRRDNMHPDNIKYYYTFLDQLSKRPWLTKINDSAVPLLKVKQHQDRFFITPNVWWVVGSDNIYNEATKSANLKLSKNALIFAEEYQGLSKRFDEFPEAKIVLNSKTELDLAATFLESSNLIFPAKNLDFQPDKSGWWKREAVDLVSWRSFLQDKYGIDNQDFDLGGGWAVGEGGLRLKVQSEKFKRNKILLARVLESTRSGELKFYQNDKLVGQINTKKDGNNVRWFEVGQLNTDSKELSVESEGDINVVNALAVLDQESWLAYQKKAKGLQDQGRIVNFSDKNTQGLLANVSYQQINPTKYKVSIRGLTKPAFLIFSENFDSLWKIRDQASTPVYSLLNGFQIEKDGDYLVEYEPQKYVYPGLIITGVTVLVLILLLISTNKSSKPKL